jgi:hypothetical protein
MATKTRRHPQYGQVDNLNQETGVHNLSQFVVNCTDTRDGLSNPGYKRAITAGNSAGTVMSATKEQISSLKPAYVVVRYKTASGAETFSRTRGHTTLSQYPYVQVGSMLTKTAEDRAMSKFLKQVHRAQTAFQGQIFLGELREALHMLRHPADALNQALAGYVHAVKQKKRQRPHTWKKALGGLWLEHSFGWMPFLNDIEDAVKAYKRLKEVDHVMPISASGSDTLDRGTTISNVGFATYVNMRETKHTADDVFVKNRGAVWVQASGTSFDSDLFGFNMREFVPTAWELLPWSFLADYFSNIGDVLENAVTSTSSLRWFNQSIVQTRIMTILHQADKQLIKSTLGANFIKVDEYSPGVHQAISRSVFRSWLITVYVPPLHFEYPGKSAQFLNMAALFANSNAIFPQTRKRWR